MAGALGAGVAACVWRRPQEVRAIAVGVGLAWAASSASTAALIWAQGRSPRAFWWTFGGGVGLRLLVLAGLMAYSLYDSRMSAPALLLAYALGVLFLLMLEYRHLKVKAPSPR